MKKVVAMLFVVALLAPAAALAQDPPRRAAPVDTVTSYEFTDGSAVQGGRYSPEGDMLRGRRRTRRDTLVRPRPHYVAEMLKSVENL